MFNKRFSYTNIYILSFSPTYLIVNVQLFGFTSLGTDPIFQLILGLKQGNQNYAYRSHFGNIFVTLAESATNKLLTSAQRTLGPTLAQHYSKGCMTAYFLVTLGQRLANLTPHIQ